jgi:hypothetical protein
MALHFALIEFGRAFATRERGTDLRDELLRRLEGADVVVVDFADVTNVSYSFADEFLGKLCADGGPTVQLEQMTAGVERVVRRAINRRTAGAAC